MHKIIKDSEVAQVKGRSLQLLKSSSVGIDQIVCMNVLGREDLCNHTLFVHEVYKT